MFEHTCVQDNRDHLLLCQFGSMRQRFHHKLINGLDLTSVSSVGAFHSVAALVANDIRPFFKWLGSYVVVASREGESASAPSGVLGAHRFFEVETWSAWTTSVTKYTGLRYTTSDTMVMVQSATTCSPMRSSSPLKKSSMVPPAALKVENFLLVGSLSTAS